MAMDLGDFRVPDDNDFKKFRNLALGTDNWVQKVDKQNLKVWVQSQTDQHVTNVKMMKVQKILSDIPATTMYDVLHDADYRVTWDSNMIEGKELCILNPNNDISYYAMKCPSPLKNRDFVMQRTWLETREEFIIFNHSIYHKHYPPKKGFIRGDSYLTGYLIRPTSKTSCELVYVTQSDPKGSLPKWVINKVAKFVAPSLMHRLHKACKKYPAWKQKNRPNYKPWLYPEQNTLPLYNPDDIITKEDLPSDNSVEDESELKESDFQEEIFLDGER